MCSLSCTMSSNFSLHKHLEQWNVARKCLKLTLSFKSPSPPLSTYVDTDVTNVINAPRRSHFVLHTASYDRWWEGLGTRLDTRSWIESYVACVPLCYLYSQSHDECSQAFIHLCIRQAINNWIVGRPGNEAIIDTQGVELNHTCRWHVSHHVTCTPSM